jgi:hypothetical protein
VTDADGHDGFVTVNVIHAVGNYLAFGLVGKVVCISLPWLTLRFVLFADAALVSKCFLLFRVHGQSWFSTAFSSLHARVDVLKLGVAVRVLIPLTRLTVARQAVPQFG